MRIVKVTVSLNAFVSGERVVGFLIKLFTTIFAEGKKQKMGGGCNEEKGCFYSFKRKATTKV